MVITGFEGDSATAGEPGGGGGGNGLFVPDIGPEGLVLSGRLGRGGG